MKERLVKFKQWLGQGKPPHAQLMMRAALIILVILLCISIFMQAHIQRRYSRSADMMREQIYQALREMSQLFARVDEPGVDVQHKLVPAMNVQYAAARALNEVLSENYSARRAVLSAEQIAGLDTAFEEYSEAYRQGLETGLARADMAAILSKIQPLIDEHFNPKGEPTPPVLIIDGASGTAADQADTAAEGE